MHVRSIASERSKSVGTARHPQLKEQLPPGSRCAPAWHGHARGTSPAAVGQRPAKALLPRNRRSRLESLFSDFETSARNTQLEQTLFANVRHHLLEFRMQCRGIQSFQLFSTRFANSVRTAKPASIRWADSFPVSRELRSAKTSPLNLPSQRSGSQGCAD